MFHKTLCPKIVQWSLQAPSSVAAERAHNAMLAAGVRGNDRTYNILVKAFAYEAEVSRQGFGGREAISAVSPTDNGMASSMPPSSWNLQKVPAIDWLSLLSLRLCRIHCTCRGQAATPAGRCAVLCEIL